MIVVTGGAGFIGSVLATEIAKRFSEKILIVDQNLKSSPKEKNLADIPDFNYMESDEFLNKLESNELNGQIKAIFHQGACSSTTEMDVNYLQKNNTEYSQALASWAIKSNVYFSYASSAAIYGNGELGYSDQNEWVSQFKPLNPYGQSKLNFDQWVIDQKLDNQIIGFRYFNVYGPNEYHKEEMRSLVHKGFGQIQNSGYLRLFKSYKPEYPHGGQKRDFVYVKDVVEAILWFYEHPEIKGIYNLGSGKAETWNDLAKALFQSMKRPLQIDYIEMPDSIKNQYQYFTEADLTKLRSTQCPVQFQNLEQGIHDYVTNHLL